MRLALLIKLAAVIVAVISVFYLLYVHFLLLVAAPGYWRVLGLSSRLTLLLTAGLGAWGVYTSIGLLRRKRWARISVVAIAAAIMLLNIATLLRRVLDHAAAHSLWEPALVSAISLAWLLFFSASCTKAFFATK